MVDGERHTRTHTHFKWMQAKTKVHENENIWIGDFVWYSQFECLCTHRHMYRAGKRPLNKNFSSDFHPLSPSVNSFSLSLLQINSTTSVRKKIKHQIFKLTWRREAFCAHALTLSHQTERKIHFLTCGNTLSTRNRPVHLVKRSICKSPTQQVTSSTNILNKNKSEVAACGCVTKCQYWQCE